ncbi:MAG: hypothetical protein HC809_14070, partial [Gammaproteobacteria bacterium]|nr:hypothetical protein [Gammaproteobacteria bacterium]
MRFTQYCVAATVVALLTGCGGGSGSEQIQVGSGAPPPPPPPPSGDSTAAVYRAGVNNQEIDPMLEASTGQPTSSSPVMQGATFQFSATSPDLEGAGYDLPVGLSTAFGGSFAAASYAGAFAQDNPVNWTEGWTVSLNGNLTIWEPAAAPSANGTCPAGTTDIGDQALPASVGGGSMDLCQLAARYATDG